MDEKALVHENNALAQRLKQAEATAETYRKTLDSLSWHLSEMFRLYDIFKRGKNKVDEKYFVKQSEVVRSKLDGLKKRGYGVSNPDASQNKLM